MIAQISFPDFGEKQNLDAWHIRTAEKHGMFCFLTMDFKLRRTVERWKDYEPFKTRSVGARWR